MLVVLTGGTGGAKLIEGLAAEIDPAELAIICNTGDDAVFHGLYVSPDIDTITYTLAGLSDSEKGWGIRGDTFTTLEQLRRLGNDAWFNLGDKDLATHITRTKLLNEGLKLCRSDRADSPAVRGSVAHSCRCPTSASRPACRRRRGSFPSRNSSSRSAGRGK